MEQLLFFLACLGLTFIINFSYIFKPIRGGAEKLSPSLGKLLKCPQCMGFWVGLFFRALQMQYADVTLNYNLGDIYNLSYGFASSFVCYMAYLLMKYFMDKYD